MGRGGGWRSVACDAAATDLRRGATHETVSVKLDQLGKRQRAGQSTTSKPVSVEGLFATMCDASYFSF